MIFLFKIIYIYIYIYYNIPVSVPVFETGITFKTLFLVLNKKHMCNGKFTLIIINHFLFFFFSFSFFDFFIIAGLLQQLKYIDFLKNICWLVWIIGYSHRSKVDRDELDNTSHFCPRAAFWWRRQYKMEILWNKIVMIIIQLQMQ